MDRLQTAISCWLVLAAAQMGAISPEAHGEETTSAGWQAGVARMDITPEEPIWLAGYASGNRRAEGALHPIWVKALALEDAHGQRAVLITSDILGFPRDMATLLLKQIEQRHGLPNDHVILSSSHTHSGPVVKNILNDIYALNEDDKAGIEHYSRQLVEHVLAAVEEALGALAPAQVESGKGVARFAANRRNNNEGEIMATHDFNGPVDHAVPVLRISRVDGDALAIVFGYACHATTLSLHEWSGDYPGFAQIAIEEAHPGVTALFFAGCGADQNPLPRRTVALARQYGQELAAAVDRVLSESMKPLEPTFQAHYSEVELALAPPPNREQLEHMLETGPYYQERSLERMIAQLDAGEPLPTTYAYPIHFWRLGEQTLVALAGEVVVEYAIFLKRMLGYDTFVMAYAHHVPGYIPSARVLAEGGYEGDSSQIIYGLPGPWADDIEERIMDEAEAIATALDLPVSEWRKD